MLLEIVRNAWKMKQRELSMRVSVHAIVVGKMLKNSWIFSMTPLTARSLAAIANVSEKTVWSMSAAASTLRRWTVKLLAHRRRKGHYPSRVLVDKIYRNGTCRKYINREFNSDRHACLCIVWAWNHCRENADRKGGCQTRPQLQRRQTEEVYSGTDWIGFVAFGTGENLSADYPDDGN